MVASGPVAIWRGWGASSSSACTLAQSKQPHVRRFITNPVKGLKRPPPPCSSTFCCCWSLTVAWISQNCPSVGCSSVYLSLAPFYPLCLVGVAGRNSVQISCPTTRNLLHPQAIARHWTLDIGSGFVEEERVICRSCRKIQFCHGFGPWPTCSRLRFSNVIWQSTHWQYANISLVRGARPWKR